MLLSTIVVNDDVGTENDDDHDGSTSNDVVVLLLVLLLLVLVLLSSAIAIVVNNGVGGDDNDNDDDDDDGSTSGSSTCNRYGNVISGAMSVTLRPKKIGREHQGDRKKCSSLIQSSPAQNADPAKAANGTTQPISGGTKLNRKRNRL